MVVQACFQDSCRALGATVALAYRAANRMSERVIDQRFVLLTEYKRGGIGTVWKARDLQNL